MVTILAITFLWFFNLGFISCAGLCCYEGRGGLCSIRLSEPLLKLRPRKDLVETLLVNCLKYYCLYYFNYYQITYLGHIILVLAHLCMQLHCILQAKLWHLWSQWNIKVKIIYRAKLQNTRPFSVIYSCAFLVL